MGHTGIFTICISINRVTLYTNHIVNQFQPVAQNFLKFMEQNNSSFNPIVMQGFSIAGYMWGEICKYASQDLPRYVFYINNRFEDILS